MINKCWLNAKYVTAARKNSFKATLYSSEYLINLVLKYLTQRLSIFLINRYTLVTDKINGFWFIKFDLLNYISLFYTDFLKILKNIVDLQCCIIFWYTAFLYTNNKRSEREIKETVPFTITAKRIKYLRISLPKETKDLYSKNDKILMKKIKDNTNWWRERTCSFFGRINIVEMTFSTQSNLHIQCNCWWHFSQNYIAHFYWASIMYQALS